MILLLGVAIIVLSAIPYDPLAISNKQWDELTKKAETLLGKETTWKIE